MSRAEDKAKSKARAEAAAAEAARIEEPLVERAQSGDRVALRELLGRHTDALFAQVILPRVGERATAEDILKATMVTAIEKLDTFTWQGRSIYFWLRQIAANKVIDHHRKNQRSRKLVDALKGESEVQSPARPGPEATLIAAEEQRINRERIGQTMAKINSRYRRAIELRLVEDRSREECARELEVTVGTFDVLLFRAVRAFRKSFGER